MANHLYNAYRKVLIGMDLATGHAGTVYLNSVDNKLYLIDSHGKHREMGTPNDDLWELLDPEAALEKLLVGEYGDIWTVEDSN